MDKLFDILFITLLCSLTLRSIARTWAYLSLASDERKNGLKEKLLRK